MKDIFRFIFYYETVLLYNCTFSETRRGDVYIIYYINILNEI